MYQINKKEPTISLNLVSKQLEVNLKLMIPLSQFLNSFSHFVRFSLIKSVHSFTLFLHLYIFAHKTYFDKKIVVIRQNFTRYTVKFLTSYKSNKISSVCQNCKLGLFCIPYILNNSIDPYFYDKRYSAKSHNHAQCTFINQF